MPMCSPGAPGEHMGVGVGAYCIRPVCGCAADLYRALNAAVATVGRIAIRPYARHDVG